MQKSSRIYQCLRCHSQVIICSRCDHGQRYCANGCSKDARAESLKRASNKYQASRQGRFKNAARQRRFRERQRDTQKETQKVTHHSSLQAPPHGSLATRLNMHKNIVDCTRGIVNRARSTKILHCHHCGEVCNQYLRHDFLRRSTSKTKF